MFNRTFKRKWLLAVIGVISFLVLWEVVALMVKVSTNTRHPIESEIKNQLSLEAIVSLVQSGTVKDIKLIVDYHGYSPLFITLKDGREFTSGLEYVDMSEVISAIKECGDPCKDIIIEKEWERDK
ncbi:MAG: hypothetical protein AAB737_03480 [Patescibacteria group bacterium]